jgi:hypothetical protein
LLVWEDPATGKTFVVNGHNRLAKALELGIPTVPVKRLLASTPEQARALGAMDNIASGGGTPWDAAKFFRDAGILDMDQAGKAGLPLNSGHAEKGLQLAALPDSIFQAGTERVHMLRVLDLQLLDLRPRQHHLRGKTLVFCQKQPVSVLQCLTLLGFCLSLFNALHQLQ